jgi:hypothetical protein
MLDAVQTNQPTGTLLPASTWEKHEDSFCPLIENVCQVDSCSRCDDLTKHQEVLKNACKQ